MPDRPLPPTAENYRQLLEYSSDVAYTLDPQGQVMWVSPYVEHLLGWTPDELVGRLSDDFIHPEDRDKYAYERAVTGVEELETGAAIRVRTKSGDYRWVLNRSFAMLSDENASEIVFGGMRDIDDLMRERERARINEEHLRLIFDAQLDPHVTLAPVHAESGEVVDFRHVDANAQALRVAGVSLQELLAVPMSFVMRPVGQVSLIGKFAESLQTGVPVVIDAFEFLPLAGDESYFLEVRAVPVEGVISLTFRDVTEAHNAIERVTESERRFRLLAENTSDVVVTADENGVIDWISPGARSLLGWDPDTMIGARFLDRVYEADLPQLSTSGEAEVRLQAHGDQYRWMRVRTRVIEDDRSMTVYAARDIETEMQAREQLAHELGHDPLTGLTNRSESLVRLEAALRESRGQAAVALLAVGVDDLRSVNEAFTHAAGDQVLTATAKRLLAFAEVPDDLARVADNEFTLLVRNVGDAAELAERADAIQKDLSGSVSIDPHTLDVTASVGIATSSGGSAVELLRDATTALHHARRRGGNRWEYIDPEMANAARERLIMRSGIRDALVAEQFQPWLQPVVDLATGAVVGYESLARWAQNGRNVSPAEFISVAESTDLIVALDRQIMRQTLQAVSGSTTAFVGLNMSAASLTAADLVESVVSVLEEFGMEPARMHLEVTETSLLQPTPGVRDAMRQVADLGVTWWVDDFGTGYSSIAHLRDLPVQGLKLDLSFTAGLLTDPTCARLAHGLVGLAKGMGMSTIAEGVESAEQAQVLRDQGWEMAQGWLYGKPEPWTG